MNNKGFIIKILIIFALVLALTPFSSAKPCPKDCSDLNPDWNPGELIPVYFAQHHHGALGEMMGDWLPNNELTATIKVKGANLSKTVKDPYLTAVYNFENGFNDQSPNGLKLNI